MTQKYLVTLQGSKSGSLFQGNYYAGLVDTPLKQSSIHQIKKDWCSFMFSDAGLKLSPDKVMVINIIPLDE